jgi:16S rRNA pseudouridine516 synthase
MSKNPSIRLDKLLSNLGYGSRREMQALAAYGEITLDNIPLHDAAAKITLTDDLPQCLRVRGEVLDPLPGMVIMLHKPLGMTCSHKDSGPLVYDVFPERWRARTPQLSSIGRLDKETSGLLLFTDDGALLHKIISPKYHVAKHYEAILARPLSDDAARIFASGTLMLEGETTPCLPATLDMIAPTRARLTITEGRYHQVRRMFAAVGNHVEALHRYQLGALALPEDLAAGRYVLLNELQISSIFE